MQLLLTDSAVQSCILPFFEKLETDVAAAAGVIVALVIKWIGPNAY